MIVMRSAMLSDGSRVDVSVDDGRIVAVDPPGQESRAADTHDLDGYLLLPAPAEPHAHLDKALTAGTAPNEAGDLAGAIVAWRSYAGTLTVDDIRARAVDAARQALAFGATAMRTHVDVGVETGLRGVEAMLEAKSMLSDMMDLQIVGLLAPPPPGSGQTGLPMLEAALELGIDVVGGAPWLDQHPTESVVALVDAAARNGRDIDLHLDETLDASSLSLEDLVRVVEETSFDGNVTASHCVSLGMQPADAQARIAAAVAAAGVAVVTCPLTNLYLQARDVPTSPPRGLTAVRALLDAGAMVAAGADNVRDPFNSMGSGDPLVIAQLLVLAAHLSPDEAYSAVSRGVRAALGMEAVEIEAGSPAELLAVRAGSLSEALAVASPDRLVFHRGALVAKTTVDSWVESPHPSGA